MSRQGRAMFANHQDREFDRRLKPRERWSPRFRLALRRRSADHPMAMFATVATAVLVTAALMPPAGVSLAATEKDRAVVAAQLDMPVKGPRLGAASEAACRGQAWGAEDARCLSALARDAGRSSTQRIRLIATGEPVGTAPNIF